MKPRKTAGRIGIHRMKEKNPAVEEAVLYLNQIPRFSNEKHTQQMLRRMLVVLGVNPEEKKIIHVAGTNGKGSVCAFLSSVLRENGCHTAVFTSPHLLSVKERFCFDGIEAEDEVFLRAFARVKAAIPDFEKAGAGHPTYFEYLFLMFVWMLEEKPADYVILETGLGGRLDATNCILSPVMTIITSISLDHMEYLGHTIGEIAGEKAGIIKPGIPLVYDDTDASAASVIRERAGELSSPSLGIGVSAVKQLHLKDGMLTFCPVFSQEMQMLWNRGGAPGVLTVPFAAQYQAVNAMLAVSACLWLDIPSAIIARGIRHAVWPGRMEQIMEGVYLDGAHNEGGIRAFAKSAGPIAVSRGGRRILLFAVVSDKEYREMAEILFREFLPDVLILTQIQYGRGLAIEDLEKAAREAEDRRRRSGNEAHQVTLKVIPTVKEAFREARREMREKDTLFCAGSLYLIGEIKEAVEEEACVER